MLAPTGPHTPLLRALAASLALGGALTACGGAAGDSEGAGSPGGTTAADCTVEAGVPAPEELTARLDLGSSVTWSVASGRTGSVNASGVATDSSTADLLPTVRAAADAGGWDVFSLDDEGFEAELLARDEAGELLGVNLRDGACPGQVLVAVSVTDYASLS
ncbi:hypothetical protein NOMA109596_00710 [Nocardioides marinus]|uniref:Lipoprotein n=1 Tax=Nocardioides marinus TaxID=374514 RepID=A0A7Y9YAI1_9ACTN|nr:hypothetical protein [Nocardioides marinus]NYI08626.1 hypothetical protein [Nocardioides marinus]